MNETRLNRGSWIALGASIFLIITVLMVGIYRYSLPTDGWILIEDGGFSSNILGLPSSIQADDVPDSLEGLPIDDIIVTRPDTWLAGSTVQYTVLRGDQTVTMPVPIGNWNLAALGKGILTHWSGYLIGLFYFLVGAFVFIRRPGNLAAQVLLFLGAVQLSMNLIFIVPETLVDRMYPLAMNAVALLGYFIWGLLLFPTLLLLSLVFPRPKRPFRTHPLLTLGALYLLLPVLIVLVGGPLAENGPFIGFGLVAVYGLLTVVSVVHTLITERSDPVARAQIRWVGLGVALVAGWQFFSNTMGFIFPSITTTPWWANVINAFIYLALPITIGIAILRYRLWDIDFIIRKTLQYTLLTGLLALFYFGSVILLQNLFESISGQQSVISIVISTLFIAALFAPLRRRIQVVIDRRFYRRKYDAQRILAQYALAARDEVSLDALSAELTRVVQESMQPESASIWLRQLQDH